MKYLVIDMELLPDVYEKVLKVKELLAAGKYQGVSEATKAVGISRSTYYKYKDGVFELKEGSVGKMVNISMKLLHIEGLLAEILKFISDQGANVLTIHQDLPINEQANVSLVFDVSNIKVELKSILDGIRKHNGVFTVQLISIGA